jgi:site-specific recombinase XerC
MASADLLECLLDYQRSYVRLRNYAATTRRGYVTDQVLFLRFLKAEHGVSSVVEVERRHVIDYLKRAERHGARGATIARKLAALRSFFGFLEQDGRIASNPVQGILPPKQESAQPRVLSQLEYGRLKQAAADDPRARALVELFLQSHNQLR